VLSVSVFSSVYGESLTAVLVARRALILLMHAVRDGPKPSSDVTVPASSSAPPLEEPLLLPLELPLLEPLLEPLLLPLELPLLEPLLLPLELLEPLLPELPLLELEPDEDPLLPLLPPSFEVPATSHGSGPAAELHPTTAPERATTPARTTSLGDTLRMATPPLALPRDY
jgi:hypothetical protein